MTYFTTIALAIVLSVPGILGQKLGQWSDVIKFPLIPVAGYVVPGEPLAKTLMVFSAYGDTDFGGERGYTQFATYDILSREITHENVSNTHHDMFCPGISQLPDGRIIISGGANAKSTSFFDIDKNAFVAGPELNIARGYHVSTTLSDGKVFTIGGSFTGPRGGKVGEVYDPSLNKWILLPNAKVDPILTKDHEGIWREDNHSWLYGWKNGSVFHAGPSKAMHWYNTGGTGSFTAAGTRDELGDAMCGPNCMYDVGKIFSTGGAQNYDNSAAIARAHLITINEPYTPATVERLPDMHHARAFANTVVLPDGTVLITGGQTYARVFTNTDAVLTPELFDPVKKTFTELAPASVPRNYHSISILLADGTVFNGGGGLCWVANIEAGNPNCDRSADHKDGQIFSPPYLFTDGKPAKRPVLGDVASSGSGDTTAKPGDSLRVDLGDDDFSNFTFSMIRIASVTHTVNSDQRRVPLKPSKIDGKTVTLPLPNDAGILLPGYWYIFVISNEGVPSMAKTIRVVL
ncbi:galactose oxidase precursor [Fusarium mexicanum]|uniref:Galactose oxidase n=1 Tax=Fusarium mexicanum TaxID=751941 RepID=A0A8H5IZ72_9HYPO|nr:galactose oxidase precursor [Fusarium mexicanum]